MKPAQSLLTQLLKLAGPMILSTSTITLMQIIDAAILSRHSSEAVAAIGPSGMAVILFQGLLFGTSGYAGTFVAHSFGRGDGYGVRRSAWLGIHTSIIAGVLALAFAWPLSQLFLLAGHAPLVARNEIAYFWICMSGSFFPVLGSALAGWLSGIGRPAVVTAITFSALAVNALVAWALILGNWGMPSMGISGAALATVAAQGVAVILYLVVFATAGGFAEKTARIFKWEELRRFLTIAAPMGLRISGELAAWTIFLIVVGRLGTVELAASSIAFRINGIAFFPALGLGQAAGVLIGHARGAGNDNDIPKITWQSLLVCEGWMLTMAIVFATASTPLIALFAGSGPDSAAIIGTGSMLMKFVAFYCLFDAANVMLGCVLAALGETDWLARAFFVCSAVFLALLWLIDRTIPGIVAEWTLATTFVFITAIIWALRFLSGKWRQIRIIDNNAPTEFEHAAPLR